MNEEQIRCFIRMANSFLEMYLESFGEDTDLLEPIMNEIYAFAKKLAIPYEIDEEEESISEWVIPNKEQMKEIIKRSLRVPGDAG